MSRLRWPDSTNSVSEKPGTIHYPALAYGLARFDDALLARPSTLGVRNVRVDRRADADGAYARYVSTYPGAELVTANETEALYHLPQAEARATESYGPNLVIGHLEANVNAHQLAYTLDQNRGSRWETGPQQEGHELEIDLGTVQELGAVVLELGPYVNDFPRILLVEVSRDGQEWVEAWRGPTVTEAVAAALRNPRDVPVTFPLDGRRGQFVRLRQLGNDPVFYWSIAGLGVVAPAAPAGG